MQNSRYRYVHIQVHGASCFPTPALLPHWTKLSTPHWKRSLLHSHCRHMTPPVSNLWGGGGNFWKKNLKGSALVNRVSELTIACLVEKSFTSGPDITQCRMHRILETRKTMQSRLQRKKYCICPQKRSFETVSRSNALTVPFYFYRLKWVILKV